jgi:hypothetical protein
MAQPVEELDVGWMTHLIPDRGRDFVVTCSVESVCETN